MDRLKTTTMNSHIKPQIQSIVIHATGTKSNAKIEDILATYPIKYHYLIDRAGRVEQLLHESESAEDADRAPKALNIAYIGGLNTDRNPADTRTREQRQAMLDLIITLKIRFPRATVIADTSFQLCFDPAAWLRMADCDLESNVALLNDGLYFLN